MTAIVVEFSAELTGPDVDRLRAAYELRLDRHIAERTYLERLLPARLDRVKADFLVRSCTPLDPTQKLSPSIQDLQITIGAPAEVTATLFETGDPDQVKAALESAGGENVRLIDDRDLGGG